MKPENSDKLQVTGSVGPGEVLMIYRDPEGSEIVCHKILDLRIEDPRQPTNTILLLDTVNEMEQSVERYKARQETDSD